MFVFSTSDDQPAFRSRNLGPCLPSWYNALAASASVGAAVKGAFSAGCEATGADVKVPVVIFFG